MIALTSIARAELAPPRLQSVFPCGARQGTEVDVEVVGKDLDDAKPLYFSHPGITAQVLPDETAKPEDKDKKDAAKPKKFKIKITKDVPPGDYDVRFVGKYGISNPRMFVVSDFAEALEKEPNNEKKDANKIEINTTVNGRIGASEDVDWFVFAAKKGQRVIIECRAWRIDSRLDGFMWLYDKDGKQLAQSQDEDLRDEKRDPFIDFEVPADGDYFVKLTDFTFNGSGDYFYRLSISTLPYIDYIMPPGVPPTGTATVTIYGRNLPDGQPAGVAIKDRPLQKITKQITMPSNPEETVDLRYHSLIRPWSSLLDGTEVRLKTDAGSSNGKLLRFTSLPPVAESPSNHDKAQAQRLNLPCCVSGQFEREGPDFFIFSAKKDEKFSIEVFSNRIGSPADPDIEILKPDDSSVATPPDWNENIGQIRFTSNTRDIYHIFNAPADGDYIVRLEHLFRQAQGGPQYIYQLEVRKELEPDFRLICQPTDEIKVDSHLVYQSGRERLDILVWRMRGMNEPITVEAKNLPPGVTCDPIVIGKDIKWGTLTITATPDAAIGEAAIEVIGTAEVSGKKLVRKARGGVIVWDTVNTPAISRMTQSIMLGVREKSPFQVTVAPTEIKVKKGEPFDLNITLKRREDMPNAVQINGNGYQLPQNLTIPTKNIDPGQTQAKITINTDKLSEGTFSFVVQGDGQVPTEKDKNKNIRCVYPSNAIKLIVEPKDPPKK